MNSPHSPKRPNLYGLLVALFNLCLFVLIIWILFYAKNDFKKRPEPSVESVHSQPMSHDEQDKVLKQMNTLSQQMDETKSTSRFLKPIIDNYSYSNDQLHDPQKNPLNENKNSNTSNQGSTPIYQNN
jgi:hypothetical protein